MSGFADVLLFLVVAHACSAVARGLGRWTGQPSVLWELLLGMLIGGVAVSLGDSIFSAVARTEVEQAGVGESPTRTGGDSSIPDAVVAISMLSDLGVLLLLFTAGLETNVRRLVAVWRPAVSVALVGAVLPVALGFFACVALHVRMPLSGHLFLAATLSATSVGITARVFEDLDELDRREARIILGAAVIDDVLGLLLLTSVVAIARSGRVDPWSLLGTIGVATLLLTALLLAGERITRVGAAVYESAAPGAARLLFPVSLAMGLAWLTDSLGLAFVIGAYFAGVVVDDDAFPPTDDREPAVRELIVPLERFLAPVFFVTTGMRVPLEAFSNPRTILLAVVFTGVAIVGKVAAGRFAGRGTDRLTVGIGMMPRGEVGLIFVAIGRELGLLSEGVLAALVVVVVTTTLLTPPGLRWSMARR